MAKRDAADAEIGLGSDIPRVDGPVPQEHAHAEIELNLAIGGGIRYLFAGRQIEFPAGRWLAYWAAIPHRIISSERPCELAWITVPVATFLAWNERDLARRLLAGELVVEGRARAGSVEQARAIDAALHGDERHGRIALLEIEALVRRLAIDARTLLPALGAKRAAAGRAPSCGVERMATWLSAHYREDIDVASCAAAVGLHPGYAMTVFRKTIGSTIRQYVERLRLAHAQRLLLTGDRNVLAIALDAGFGSSARFHVAYRRAFGCTPAAYRRARR